MRTHNKKSKSKILKLAIIAGIIFDLIQIQGGLIRASVAIDPIAYMGSDITFGIVYPGERMEKEFIIRAQNEYLGNVSYNLSAQVKPKDGTDTEYCLNNPNDTEQCYPFLCDNLSISSAENENDTVNESTLNPPLDTSDRWKVVLDTPPIKGFSSQNSNDKAVGSAGEYGCDIKLVLTGFSNYNHDPKIDAVWEMSLEKDQNGKYQGTDDSTSDGAQFTPTGHYGTQKGISLCAVAGDIDGMENVVINTEIFYPGNPDTAYEINPDINCGTSKEKSILTRLDKVSSYELFCENIQNANSNLVHFSDATDFSSLCGQSGKILNDTANVYCFDSALSFKDPSGDYRAIFNATDKLGLNSKLENQFSYLPMTVFSADFTSIDYGKVRENEQTVIAGDQTFGIGDGKATVRNDGNTTLNIYVSQDDMGIGKNNNIWNIAFGAKIGNYTEFTNYEPFSQKVLSQLLNVSESAQADFAIKVLKYPDTPNSNYNGNMILGAMPAGQNACE